MAPACNFVGPGADGAQEGDGPTEVEKLTAERDAAFAEISRIRAENQQIKADAAAAAVEGRISLERARLVAIRHAQENKDVYAPSYRDVELVWEVESSLEQQEFYYVYLLYRPSGFVGTPGREEFIMDKTGLIEFRQVLEDPLPEARPAAEGP